MKLVTLYRIVGHYNGDPFVFADKLGKRESAVLLFDDILNSTYPGVRDLKIEEYKISLDFNGLQEQGI